MKKILLATIIVFSITACNNESEDAGSKDSGIKGNGDSSSGGTIPAVIDSSTSINQSTGTLHDSLGTLKAAGSTFDSSKMKK